MIGIYKITNKINNKSYIGQSINIEQRWKTHKTSPFNKNCVHYNCLFYKAIRKYGIDNFIFEVLEECEKNRLNEREIYWIAYYQTHNKKYGYNMTDGGDCGAEKKYNERKILNKWKQGATLSALKKEFHCCSNTISSYLRNNQITIREIRSRGNLYKAIPIIQYSLTGEFIKKHSSVSAAAEYIGIDYKTGQSSNISAACKRKITTAYNFIWKYENDPISVEELVKNANSKRHHGNRKVNQYDLNGNFIKTFNTISEAADSVGLKSITGITNACTGRSQSSKGYIWRYANE